MNDEDYETLPIYQIFERVKSSQSIDKSIEFAIQYVNTSEVHDQHKTILERFYTIQSEMQMFEKMMPNSSNPWKTMFLYTTAFRHINACNLTDEFANELRELPSKNPQIEDFINIAKNKNLNKPCPTVMPKLYTNGMYTTPLLTKMEYAEAEHKKRYDSILKLHNISKGLNNAFY
ncbi:hypothetical protein TBLA_0I03010 [Henningerozyma blattae CBS 6284]|uniref:Uncharacterized protein n=1 Tax=Henningerozyma blattae (strain ATCC 34711 / CBS 6284 / DSM 70876 / NBRC 10599 / NRRL Y-10934 / UCD 77-7) TaxID=1071380 RepID=I2H9A5_HENB6|nr:hypothetical protein TBLA_0I03010 [Tetrapisispora blattae CBS 6284]CCH62957.1 hypothetical protein TBLA_0I03010 [Tetrapisispora blattae CBS 6284]